MKKIDIDNCINILLVVGFIIFTVFCLQLVNIGIDLLRLKLGL